MKTRFVLPLALLMLAATPALAQHHGAHAGADKQAGKPTANAPAKLTPEDFDKLDANKDGYVTAADLPKDHPLRGHVSMADRNRDGKLDRAEFAALVQMQ